MKKLIIMLLMLFSINAYSQWGPLIGSSPNIDITVTGDTTVVLYVLFPDQRGTWYVSQTLPTDSYAGSRTGRAGLQYVTTGYNVLCWESNKSSGTPDSMGCVMKPLIWEPKDKEFTVAND